MESTAGKWTSVQNRGQIQAVIDMLERLENGEPLLTASGHTDFVHKCLLQLERFCTWTPPPKQEEATAATALQGKAALDAKLQHIKDSHQNPSLQELTLFSVWRHMLSEPDREFVVNLKNK
eukprot:5020717-Amphidinium_carterae.1